MLKLFVWKNVLRDYSAGIAFAMAHDVDEARLLILQFWINVEGYDSETLTNDLEVEPEVFDETVGFAKWGGA